MWRWDLAWLPGRRGKKNNWIQPHSRLADGTHQSGMRSPCFRCAIFGRKSAKGGRNSRQDMQGLVLMRARPLKVDSVCRQGLGRASWIWARPQIRRSGRASRFGCAQPGLGRPRKRGGVTLCRHTTVIPFTKVPQLKPFTADFLT